MKTCIVLAYVLLLAACQPTTGDKPNTEKAMDPVLYVDRATGCHYLGPDSSRSLTPRMAADGIHQMGCGEVQK